MSYIPDRWVVIKISGYKDHPEPIYKVFACWYGGFAGADSWKLNSGITSVTQEGRVYSFMGASGSVYECHEDSYGTNFYGGGVLDHLIKSGTENGLEIEVLPEETDFMELDYE